MRSLDLRAPKGFDRPGVARAATLHTLLVSGFWFLVSGLCALCVLCVLCVFLGSDQ